MAAPVPFLKPFFLDNNGEPLAGGLLYSYSAGTSTPKATYVDEAGFTVNANPLVLDSAGRGFVYLGDGAYKLVLKDSAGVTIWTKDNITGGQTIQSVSSIFAMKALSGSGSGYINVLGYNSAGDGGGGIFYWDSASTDADDGGVTIIPLSAPASGRWKRLYSGAVNVKWFGAVGDGTTIDTAAITSAAGYVQSLTNGGVLYFPASQGNYLFGAAITFGTKTTVRADPGAMLTSPGYGITFNGPFSAEDATQCFSSTIGAVTFARGTIVNPYWWGAKGDGTTDDKTAIQAAINSLPNGGICKFLPGVYACNGFLTVPARNLTLQGSGANQTRLKYTGTTYGDFVTVTDINDNEYVMFRDLGFAGGTFLAGKSRYLLAADNFNGGCEIVNCLFRDSVGMIKITNGYLSRISHNVFQTTTPNRTAAGISSAQWLEVYDTGKAPIMLQTMNNCDISHNYCLQIGSEVDGATRGYAAVLIGGAGISVNNLGIESNSAYTSGATTYVLSTKKTLVLTDFIGTFNGLYFETCSPDEELLYQEGTAYSDVHALQAYNCQIGGVMFRNAGIGPMRIRQGKAWRINCPTLQAATNADFSQECTVDLEDVSVISGLRKTDAAINADDDNVFDSHGSYSVDGMTDGADPTYTVQRRYIPKILIGYTVSDSSDADGTYIRVNPGVMLLESGKTVNSKHLTAQRTNLAVFKLRPTTVSRSYRVYVGRAGQPYLVKQVGAFTDPTGNWIAEFSTDGAGVISAISSNVRLTYNGEYTPNTTNVQVKGTAAPVSGYWQVGDIVINTAPGATGAPRLWICVTAGTPGTWVDPHIYALGVSGGQTLIGGTASGNNLTLRSTTHATRGKIVLGQAGASAYDEVNERLGVGTASPTGAVEGAKSVDGGDVSVNVNNLFSAAASLDETASFNLLFAGLFAAGWTAGKIADFTSAGNRTSYLAGIIRSAGTNTERLRLEVAGNSLLGGAGSYGGGTKVLYIPNCTAAPASDPSGGGILYVNAGALTYRGSAGTVSVIAPA